MEKKLNNNKSNFIVLNTDNSLTTKNFPSSTREWNNSIYSFNKNYLSLIPDFSKLTMKLLRNYFNAFNFLIEKRVRKYRLRLRFRRFSSNKIYISNGVFKHTNDKVTITFYVYNRQKDNYIYLIEKKFKTFLIKDLMRKLINIRYKINNFIEKEKTNKFIVYTEALHYWHEEDTIKYAEDYEMLYKKLIKRVLRKYRKYFLYKQLLFINKSKFNYNYLSYLTYLLKKLYKKNVQFDIVNLKYFYLNSDIFTQSILLKIKKKRRALAKKLKRLVFKSNVNKVSKYLSPKPIIKNTIIKDKNSINNSILSNLYKNKKSVKRTVLSLIKYKRVVGVRIEAHGRLTKRYTASRSLSKFKYEGNLINLDSSYLGLSSVLLRGNLRSNLQYTNLRSKTRIGSFGLKGWISGY